MSDKIKAKREKVQAIIRGSAGEPQVTREKYREQLLRAINWYNANTEEKDLRAYAEHYVKSIKALVYLHGVSKASFLEIKSVGILGRLHARGQYLDLNEVEKLTVTLEQLKSKYTKPKPSTIIAPTGPVVSVQERIAEAASRYAADVDHEIDMFCVNKQSSFSMTKYILANGISGAVSKKIGEKYKRLAAELDQAVNTKDPDLKQGYRHFTKPSLKAFYEFVRSIVSACTQVTTSSYVTRKPKTTKSKPVSAGSIKPLKHYPPLNLTSINPDKIIGAEELWTFNPETRKLTWFKCNTPQTLSVKGSSVINFDPVNSVVKTLRKPEEFFKNLTSKGKRAMANAWKKIKAKEASPRGRINEDTLLIAVN